jgi:hypothetical protein
VRPYGLLIDIVELSKLLNIWSESIEPCGDGENRLKNESAKSIQSMSKC